MEGPTRREPAAARAVSVFLLARPRSWRVSGSAWGCDSVPLDQPPLPSVQTARSWEGTFGGTQEVWADPGSPWTRGLMEMGSDSAAPQVARLPRAPGRVPAGVPACPAPWSTARGEASGPPTRFPARRARFCECARAGARRSLAGPALRGARPAGAPFRDHSLGPLPRRADVVPTSQTCCGHLDVFTSGLTDVSCSQPPFL